MNVTRPLVSLLALLLSLSPAGCRKEQTPLGQAEAERLGQLPGLRQTAHPGLKAEMLRLLEEAGTPAQLTELGLAHRGAVAQALTQLSPRSKLSLLRNETEKLFPAEAFQFSPARLHDAVQFCRKYEETCRKLVQVRDAQLAGEPSPADAGATGTRASLGLRMTAGYAADMAPVDAVRVLNRIEAFRVADALAGHDLPTAVQCVRSMFRWSQCLDAEKHPVPRLEAALMRGEALTALRAVVEHPQTSPEQIELLLAVLEGTLAAWPPDAHAWIGERALGTFIYELVRSGQPINWLSPEERRRLGGQQDPQEVLDRARRTIDDDELYYLQAMRAVIAACDKPYYQRASLFQEIRSDLRRREETFDYPWIAGRLLLLDVEKGHLAQARDRANCEMWAIALREHRGRTPTQLGNNPVSGKPYQLDHRPGQIIVRNAGSDDGNPEALIVKRIAPK